jgi:Na+-transporting NADH:ubiquinone oxidoreductase subunit A
MTTIVNRINKGLDIPISGEPVQKVLQGPDVQTVALLGDDYLGMKPTMLVREGDKVKLGQALFEDKKNTGVFFTSPACGTVKSVIRGAKRKFEGIIIEVAGNDEVTFESFKDHHLHNLDREKVVDNLAKSGLWTTLRTRPYSKIPALTDKPHSIFVTAADTSPLAADPEVVLSEHDFDRFFRHGLQALSTLTEGHLYLCRAAGAKIPGADDPCLQDAAFAGPHPAGLVGTHIHTLDPVDENKSVWHIGYQDVIAVGQLFLTGKLFVDRVISLAGPMVKKPQLLRTRLGASVADLIKGNYDSEKKVRVISGSVVSGRICTKPFDYLGRFHNQISILEEGGQRELLGWAVPGFEKFSVTRAFASALNKFTGGLPMTTSSEGSHRAIVPIGSYEKVMPLDIIPTALLKALLVNDTETAQMLGCLELDEEDLALCTFVCPGKNEYGPLLRKCLDHIEREG